MTIKGLKLCEDYFYECGLPAIEKEIPEALSVMAFGLVGEGSECYGFDDEISMDHDWGPGFIIWLSDDIYEEYEKPLKRIYDELPKTYMGFTRMLQSVDTIGRMGVHSIKDFYFKHLGIDSPPDDILAWRKLPENGLSTTTNGKIFSDIPGDFSSFRNKLKEYYPQDLYKKKLAKHLALAAQSGQYNMPRLLLRNEQNALFSACSIFMDNISQIIFLINRTYRPYYKWSDKMMRSLPILGRDISVMMRDLFPNKSFTRQNIDVAENISIHIASELRNLGITTSNDNYLMAHAYEIYNSITDPVLKQIHIMA